MTASSTAVSSARWLSASRRAESPVRTSVRRASSVSKVPPTVLANSSSSAGNTFSFTSVTVTLASADFPRSASFRWSSPKRTRVWRAPPAVRPITASSISGSTLPPPMMKP
jgi:hypothetical protein